MSPRRLPGHGRRDAGHHRRRVVVHEAARLVADGGVADDERARPVAVPAFEDRAGVDGHDLAVLDRRSPGMPWTTSSSSEMHRWRAGTVPGSPLNDGTAPRRGCAARRGGRGPPSRRPARARTRRARGPLPRSGRRAHLLDLGLRLARDHQRGLRGVATLAGGRDARRSSSRDRRRWAASPSTGAGRRARGSGRRRRRAAASCFAIRARTVSGWSSARW